MGGSPVLVAPLHLRDFSALDFRRQPDHAVRQHLPQYYQLQQEKNECHSGGYHDDSRSGGSPLGILNRVLHNHKMQGTWIVLPGGVQTASREGRDRGIRTNLDRSCTSVRVGPGLPRTLLAEGQGECTPFQSFPG